MQVAVTLAPAQHCPLQAPHPAEVHRPLLSVDRTVGIVGASHIMIPVDDTDDSEEVRFLEAVVEGNAGKRACICFSTAEQRRALLEGRLSFTTTLPLTLARRRYSGRATCLELAACSTCSTWCRSRRCCTCGQVTAAQLWQAGGCGRRGKNSRCNPAESLAEINKGLV